MKSKRVWVAWYDEGYKCSSPKGVFETAFECKEAIDKHAPFDRSVWPRAKPWKGSAHDLIWRRKDGWTAEGFLVGAFEE